MNTFTKQPNENDAQWVVRLHLDPWFEAASTVELADFTGIRVELVRAALRRWAASAKVRRIHQHASAVARAIDWPGTPDGLVHIALERYAQRFVNRQRAGTSSETDDEVKHFLARNRVASEVPSSS